MTDLTTAASPSPRHVEVGTPKERFYEQEWFDRDLELVFRPRWHLAAHVTQLAKPGDFVRVAIGPDEAMVVRTRAGDLVAYHNFCPHRGHRLTKDDSGTFTRNIMCQYHGWTFDKENGSCLAATRMDEGFDMSPWALKKAWVEDFYGLVFINFSDDRPVSVADSTANLFADRSPFGGYDLNRMKLAATRELVFPANWKVVRENDDECYHCALNHPELAERYDPWAGFTVVDDLTENRDMWTGHDWAFLELGFQQSAPVCEVPTPRVHGDDGFDHQDVQFFWAPSGHIIVQRDHAWIWSIRPLGPESTLLTQHWLVADTAEEGKDYHEDQLVHLLNLTMHQDRDLCEEVQRGVRMRSYTPGPLNPHHQGPATAFYHWYDGIVS